MVLGYNHNIMYKGEVFHVQTEDSGVNNPHIITLLYRGGVIISSKKTSYADIVKMENLELVVEDLMKEQHKNMMHSLKSGEFDEKAFAFKPQLIENYEIPTLVQEDDRVLEIFSATSASNISTSKASVSLLFDLPAEPSKKSSEQIANKTSDQNKSENESKVLNLDEAILSFFTPK